MIENRLLKFLDANPLLIKSLGAYLELHPLLDRINNNMKLVHAFNWYEFGPHHPSQELIELMRSS